MPQFWLGDWFEAHHWPLTLLAPRFRAFTNTNTANKIGRIAFVAVHQRTTDYTLILNVS